MRKLIKDLLLKMVNLCVYCRKNIGGSGKILFYGLNPMNYTMFRPIQKEIELISDTEIYYCFKDSEEKYAEYIKLGVPKNKIISLTRVRLNIWDAIILADFIKPKYLFPNKLVYICHGVAAKKWSFVDDKGNLVTDDYRYNNALREYDIVHFHNEVDYNNAKERGLFKRENSGSVIGMCPVDELVHNSTKERIEAIRRKYIPNVFLKKDIVIYAPTWDDNASFKRRGGKILEALSCIDAFVIVKPHPLCISNNVGGSDLNLPVFMEKMFPRKNYIIVTDTPYEVMAIADFMISDFGSITFEFTVLRRPIYLFEGNGILEKVADMDQYDKLKRCCYVLNEKEDINKDTFFKRKLDQERLHHMDVVQRTYLANVGFATECAVNNLIDKKVIAKKS